MHPTFQGFPVFQKILECLVTPCIDKWPEVIIFPLLDFLNTSSPFSLQCHFLSWLLSFHLWLHAMRRLCSRAGVCLFCVVRFQEYKQVPRYRCVLAPLYQVQFFNSHFGNTQHSSSCFGTSAYGVEIYKSMWARFRFKTHPGGMKAWAVSIRATKYILGISNYFP